MDALFSADSHVVEIEDCYADIDPKFRARAPKLVYSETTGAGLQIDGMAAPVPYSFICAAGRKPEDVGKPVHWEELHPAGHDPKARLGIQDEELAAREAG